ncbi:MAG: patatin-like phospholipase family protein [Flavobacteriales bacterium]|nr:patatin-like phospholipase family protein [Flavobacteriales bacterium]MDW8431681.1 patatin-like phospholipase family protein [Flavobacteriales bacterium]
MTPAAWEKKPPFWKQVLFFFPVQLLLVHIRSSILLFSFLAVLTLVITGNILRISGGYLLFLDPEYLGRVSMSSYFIVGFAAGGFISAFNIASYLTHSRTFPFLATVARPFSRYSLNNFILPSLFLGIYLFQLWKFHQKNYPDPVLTYLRHGGSFMAGFIVFTAVTFSYFLAFGRDMRRIFGIDPENPSADTSSSSKKNWRIRPVRILLNPEKDKLEAVARALRKESWETATYLASPFRIRLARPTHHYNPEVLDRVFSESHFYAFLYSALTILSIFILGLLREKEWLILPAAAIFFLYFTLLMMFTGGLNYFFGRWSVLAFICLYVGYNVLTARGFLTTESRLYGLNYEKMSDYHPDSLARHYFKTPADTFQEKRWHEGILNKWKKKVSKGKPEDIYKPPIVFISCTGGGSKAATWTFYSLCWADSLLGGKLLQHTYLISGSSGGALGAAYLRELHYRRISGLLKGASLDSLTECIAADILNPVVGAMLLSDFFIPTGRFKYERFWYPKDRGYAFEKHFNQNTGYVLDRKFYDYATPEYNATLPIMIFSPTIINDGRRMLFCTQPLGFMTQKSLSRDTLSHIPKLEDIEFSKLCRQEGYRNISFLSVLRANATFPLVMPPVSLPTRPRIELMDAGFRDNYGIQNILKYIFHMRQWLNQNVSRIILLDVTDRLRHDQYLLKRRQRRWRSAIESLFTPFGGVLSNITTTQVYVNEQMLKFVAGSLSVPVHHVLFDLANEAKDEISVSFHLTSSEKKDIVSAVALQRNQNTLAALMRWLGVRKLKSFHTPSS